MNEELEALQRLSAVASMYCDECAIREEDLDRGLFEKDYKAIKLIEKALNEHEQYKLIEKELGIGLITLISVFDKGFYAWVKDEEHEEPHLFHFFAKDLELCIDGKSLIVYEQCSEEVYGEYDFKDYGNTWALKREELENKEEIEKEDALVDDEYFQFEHTR